MKDADLKVIGKIDDIEYLKRWLNCTHKINEEISILEREIFEAKGRMLLLTSFDNDTVCKNSKKIESYCEIIQSKISRLYAIKSKITEVIFQVDDSTYRAILSSRHLGCNNWSKVAEDMHYSEEHTKRLYKKALQEVLKKQMGHSTA